jgi:hypothetical protein
VGDGKINEKPEKLAKMVFLRGKKKLLTQNEKCKPAKLLELHSFEDVLSREMMLVV